MAYEQGTPFEKRDGHLSVWNVQDRVNAQGETVQFGTGLVAFTGKESQNFIISGKALAHFLRTKPVAGMNVVLWGSDIVKQVKAADGSMKTVTDMTIKYAYAYTRKARKAVAA